MSHYDAVILGHGITAKALALTLMQSSIQPLIVTPSMKQQPTMPLALTLSQASRNMLTHLGMAIDSYTTPINAMCINTASLNQPWHIHSPNHPTLGHVIKHSDLNQLLTEQTKGIDTIVCNNIQWEFDQLFKIMISDHITTTPMLFITHPPANINLLPPSTINHQQLGHIGFIHHQKPHQNKAYQCFTKHGPIATLPLKNTHMSHFIASLDDTIELTTNRLNHALPHLGAVEIQPGFCSLPLITQLSQCYQHQHAILVGDLNHRIHPLAGQGFNLTLLDIAAIHQLIAPKKHSFSRLGILYQKERQPHNQWMASFCQSLLNQYKNHDTLMGFGHQCLNGLTAFNTMMIDEANGLHHGYPLTHSTI